MFYFFFKRLAWAILARYLIWGSAATYGDFYLGDFARGMGLIL
jgi:hypothetical protein